MGIVLIYIGIIIWFALMIFVCKLGGKVSRNKYKDKL